MNKISTKELTITSLFIALTYVSTWLIKIQLPIGAQGGLIHLGNVPFFVAAILFGKRTGILSGAVGMTLFDLTSGWTAWAPITFITCFFMGYAVAEINKEKINSVKLIFSFFVAMVIKVLGYYIGEAIIFSSIIIPLKSILGNVLQILISSIIVYIIIKPLNKALSSNRR